MKLRVHTRRGTPKDQRTGNQPNQDIDNTKYSLRVLDILYFVIWLHPSSSGVPDFCRSRAQIIDILDDFGDQTFAERLKLEHCALLQKQTLFESRYS